MPVLWALIERDGVSRVVSTILGKPSGWSNLNPFQDAELGQMYSDGRFIAVHGYGIQYNDQPVEKLGETVVQADTEYWTPESVSGDCWIDYVYIIEEDGTVSWAENLLDMEFSSLEWHSGESLNEYCEGVG